MKTFSRYLIIIALLLVTYFIGRNSARPEVKEIEVHDTTYVYKQHTYDWKGLEPIDVEFSSPDIPRMCFYDITKVKTEVINDTTYIVLPRESKYLQKDNVQIWYSGIDPTIDRLLIEEKVREVTKIVHEPWDRNIVSIYGSLGYNYGLDARLGLRYQYFISRRLYTGARVEYNPIDRKCLIMADFGLDIFRF